MPRIQSQKNTLWLLIYLESKINSLNRLCGSSKMPVWRNPLYRSGAFIISSQFHTHCHWDTQVRPEPALGKQAEPWKASESHGLRHVWLRHLHFPLFMGKLNISDNSDTENPTVIQ